MQERTGVRRQLETIERRLFRDFMPDQHRALFSKLPFLIVGSLDTARRPWASILVGRPGFVSSPDARTLRVAARPASGDPLTANLIAGAPVALLGIQLSTRRRNRLNGTLVEVSGSEDEVAGGFVVRAGQSFGNCPKYIQAREPAFIAEPASMQGGAHSIHHLATKLSPRAAAIVARADTFFIASASARASGVDAADGVDVSHRGGRPGFVLIEAGGGASLLTWPDFVGNYFFNTLGNLQVNPRAGLLFVDFDSGDLLCLTGQATIVWGGPEVDAFAGAERLLRFAVEEGVLIEGALPLRWTTVREAPELRATGRWQAG